MDRAELAVTVRTQVALVVGVDVAQIEESTNLRTEYGIDSLELMEIGTRLENELGVRFQVENLMDLECVKDAIDLLGERV
ncbi:acyl carrier protein [Streptomyces sp. NPDC012935]|uniref:acyl carrier protein n=1 Tax=Streptomyces sp. NPDC012935 TaxID=3364857 RepID=UPI00369882EF